jgi:hypothetical protein
MGLLKSKASDDVIRQYIESDMNIMNNIDLIYHQLTKNYEKSSKIIQFISEETCGRTAETYKLYRKWCIKVFYKFE